MHTPSVHEAVPAVGGETMLTFRGSPSGSLSFDRTSTEAVPPSSTAMVSPTAEGAEFGGGAGAAVVVVGATVVGAVVVVVGAVVVAGGRVVGPCPGGNVIGGCACASGGPNGAGKTSVANNAMVTATATRCTNVFDRLMNPLFAPATREYGADSATSSGPM